MRVHRGNKNAEEWSSACGMNIKRTASSSPSFSWLLGRFSVGAIASDLIGDGGVGIVECLGEIHQIAKGERAAVLPLIAIAIAPGDGDVVHRPLGRIVFPDRGADVAV